MAMIDSRSGRAMAGLEVMKRLTSESTSQELFRASKSVSVMFSHLQ